MRDRQAGRSGATNRRVAAGSSGPRGSAAPGFPPERDGRRDRGTIAATARLEAELTTLGSLAVETGRARSRLEIADAALAVLSRATTAQAGLILSFGDDGFDVIARRGLSDRTIALIDAFRGIGRRLRAALDDPDAVIAADLEATPIDDAIRRSIAQDGVGHVLFVGLRVGGELHGLLGLGWPARPPAVPSDAAVLQAAALVASALENARLLERIERGFEEEHRLASRLETLVGLTRLPEAAGDDGTLASYLLERVVTALGGAGGIVVRAEADRLTPLASHALDPAFERLRASRRANDWSFFRRLSAGEAAFLAPIAEGLASAPTLAAAGEAGYRAFAAFAIPGEARLEGALLVFFDQPVEDLPMDQRTLEAIGRIVAIAFANQRLRRTAVASEERYRRLFQESPDALTLQDAAGRIVDANRGALELYRAGRADLVGRNVADLIAGERHVTRIGDGMEVYRATGRRADGSLFPQEVIVSRLELDGEDRILARIRDLTEQEQLQQELVQAQKMEAIGQLVSGVAHELNNPLAAIIAFSQLIRRDARLPEDMRRDADLLLSEADRTRRIVQNLLDFARQRPPERVPTAIRPLVASVLELQAYSLTAGQIAVEIDVPDALPPVYLDRAQMQQVMLNLTLNAIQAIRATKASGIIRVSAREASQDDRRAVRIAISDDGPGVLPEHRERLFLPFFTTKEPGEGTGLGLPVSFGIVAAHGGSLSFESGDDGRGATFVITLPVGSETDEATPPRVPAAVLAREGDSAPDEDSGTRSAGGRATRAPEAATASSQRDGAVAPSGSRRVLVLDDEPAIRAFLARILRPGGFDPILTADGDEAIARVREEPVAAVLCDYRMAGMSGTQVFEALTAIRPELRERFVFMSGDVLNSDLAAFAGQRGVHLLAKPFDIDTVRRLVAGIVEGGATGS